jgi:hypothetical protein
MLHPIDSLKTFRKFAIRESRNYFFISYEIGLMTCPNSEALLKISTG